MRYILTSRDLRLYAEQVLYEYLLEKNHSSFVDERRVIEKSITESIHHGWIQEEKKKPAKKGTPPTTKW